MKLLMAVLALISFGIFVPNMYADDLSLNLGALGIGTVDLGPVAAGTGVVTYDSLNVPILQNGLLLGVYNFNFTASYTNVGVFPVDVASELIVTESCVAVGVTLPPFPAPQNPCPGTSFAYTNTNVGNIVDVMGGVNIGADVNADTIVADAGLGIGAGTETIGFGNPPSATPEPGSLGLMGTGLLGIAGIVRRKLRV